MIENKPGLRARKKLDVYFSVIDYKILVPVLVVAIIGLFVLSRVLATGYEGNGQIMLIRQMGAVIAGLIIALVIGAFETPMLRLMAYAVYIVSVILLLVVLLDNFSLAESTGADSWLMLPFIGSFQPSELSKIGIIMLSSYFFADIKSGKISKLKGSLALVVIYAIPIELIRRQPDLGTILVIVFIIFCQFFIFEVPYKYIFLVISSGIAALPIIWSFFLKTHQKNRILTFLYPGFSPSQVFHIEQAKAAIRAGGLTGSKLGVPVVVPVKESDFIYTAVSEQMGLVGTTALVIFLFYFIIQGLILSSKLKDTSLKLIAGGMAVMFGIHTIENIGMCIGIMPITGIPLPFVSLGGTSMIVNFLALGVLLCIAIENNYMTRDY